ncbi:MAG: SGNH/GDSL hydrolase family protein [Flavitalea sp.]
MKLLTNMILYLAITLFSFLSCTKGNDILPVHEMPADTNTSVYPEQNITWLALGDSYTIGHGVAVSERFPKQTTDLLIKNNITTDKLQYIATDGWNTFDLQAALTRGPLDKSYTIVSLLIGVNDQYQGGDPENYRVRFTDLLQKSIALAGNNPSHVFVVSIPDYSVTPFVGTSNKKEVSKAIELFNRINFEITRDYKCRYTDVTSISRQSASSDMIAGDGLHPSGKQYHLWAVDLAKAITAELK